MKCIYCKGSQFERRHVEEELKQGDDLVLIPIETLACSSCGERYYDRRAMQILEDWQSRIRSNRAVLQPVGKVLRVAV